MINGGSWVVILEVTPSWLMTSDEVVCGVAMVQILNKFFPQ